MIKTLDQVVNVVDNAAICCTQTKKFLLKKCFPSKERISYTYPKIINFSNEKKIHTPLKKPIFHAKEKVLILTTKKNFPNKKFLIVV